MKHPFFLQTALIVCTILFNCESSILPQSQNSVETPLVKKPNVLILMTDQHHADWIGCLGEIPVKTPNLDKLAEEGTLFTHSFVPVSFCSPTRYALATGRYPSSAKIGRNINDKDDPLRLREPVQTFNHQLAKAGYHNHWLGKWHVGNLSELNCFPDAEKDIEEVNRRMVEIRRALGKNMFDPQRKGETEPVQNIYLTETIAKLNAQLTKQNPRGGQNLGLIGRNRIKAEFQQESVLADYCIELIREHHAKNEPFAITYSVSPPHPLYTAPVPFYDLYDPKVLPLPVSWDHPAPLQANAYSTQFGAIYGEEGLREFLRCYYAQVSMIDSYIGRILDALRHEGILDETFVVFLSDHGNLCGHHAMIDKLCTTSYDDLMRVPTIVRFPGVFPKGKREERFITTMDINATILDTVGAKPLEKSVGKSFRNMVNGGTAIHTEVFNERGALDQQNNGKLYRTIRTEKWKFVLASDGTQELYDLVSDSHEIKNVAADSGNEAILDELKHILFEHIKKIDDQGRVRFGL
jgi:arylsulfatase A-like enzyme